MKRIFAFFIMIFVFSVPLLAASTCETRVDSHPDATTKQRVVYCLTPEPPEPLPAGPSLVYYGVTDTSPMEEEEEVSSTVAPVYFDKDGVSVSKQFKGTTDFPSFENDTLSEQERVALEKLAQEDARKALALRYQKPSRTGDSALSAKESKKGESARQQKAQRFRQETTQTHQSVVNEYNTNSLPAGKQPMNSSVPTQTPPNEIQQAYALENNPLSQPSANASGAAPSGFLADDLMAGEQSFGYNATDPAMQQP